VFAPHEHCGGERSRERDGGAGLERVLEAVHELEREAWVGPGEGDQRPSKASSSWQSAQRFTGLRKAGRRRV
jgi:hypothetical protein